MSFVAHLDHISSERFIIRPVHKMCVRHAMLPAGVTLAHTTTASTFSGLRGKSLPHALCGSRWALFYTMPFESIDTSPSSS